MKTFIFSTIVGLSLIACSHDLNMQTTPVPESEKAKTTLGLYVTAKEAGKYLAQDKSAIFIDVEVPQSLNLPVPPQEWISMSLIKYWTEQAIWTRLEGSE